MAEDEEEVDLGEEVGNMDQQQMLQKEHEHEAKLLTFAQADAAQASRPGTEEFNFMHHYSSQTSPSANPPTPAADAASTAAQPAAAATAAAAAAVAVPAPASAATAMLLARSDGSFLGELTENWDPTDAYYALIGVVAVAYGAYTVFSDSIEKAKAADARQQREGRTRGNSDKGSSMEDLAKFLRDQE